jgi:hypothetical protein
VDELCHALAVELGNDDQDLHNIPDLDDIVSVCAGLVIVDKASNNIRLVRYTTQEFFKTIRNTWILTAQQEITATCLTYLSFKSFRSGSCHNDKEFEERCDKNVFLDYAVRYWSRHAETVQKQVFELTSKFIQNNNLLSCAVQKMSISIPKHKVDRLQSAIPERNDRSSFDSDIWTTCTSMSVVAAVGEEDTEQ